MDENFNYLMERLRAKNGAHKTFKDESKALRMTLLEKRYAVEVTDKSNLQECLEILQQNIVISTLPAIAERLEVISRHLGLKFVTSPSGSEWFISSDMFYVEIISEANGIIKEVKIHHDGSAEQNCEELKDTLTEQNFKDFTFQLEGLISIYNLNAEKKIKSKAFSSLQLLEADIILLAEAQGASYNDLYELVHKSNTGLVQPRNGGYPMRITYFISPYELLLANENSKSTCLWNIPEVEYSATICLESSCPNKMQTESLVTIIKAEKTDDGGRIGPPSIVFEEMTETNTNLLPACFLLKLKSPMPMHEEYVNEIKEITDMDVGKVSELEPVLQLIRNELSSKYNDCDGNTSLVVLPDQQHCYMMTENCYLKGYIVQHIPFYHPAHIPKILNILRQQALFNSVVVSCLRLKQIEDDSGLKSDHLPHEFFKTFTFFHIKSNRLNNQRTKNTSSAYRKLLQSEFKKMKECESNFDETQKRVLSDLVVFEITPLSVHILSICFEHPVEEAIVTVELNLSDICEIDCSITIASDDVTNQAVDAEDCVVSALEASFSIPATMRTLIYFWDDKNFAIDDENKDECEDKDVSDPNNKDTSDSNDVIEIDVEPEPVPEPEPEPELKPEPIPLPLPEPEPEPEPEPPKEEKVAETPFPIIEIDPEIEIKIEAPEIIEEDMETTTIEEQPIVTSRAAELAELFDLPEVNKQQESSVVAITNPISATATTSSVAITSDEDLTFLGLSNESPGYDRQSIPEIDLVDDDSLQPFFSCESENDLYLRNHNNAKAVVNANESTTIPSYVSSETIPPISFYNTEENLQSSTFINDVEDSELSSFTNNINSSHVPLFEYKETEPKNTLGNDIEEIIIDITSDSEVPQTPTNNDEISDSKMSASPCSTTSLEFAELLSSDLPATKPITLQNEVMDVEDLDSVEEFLKLTDHSFQSNESNSDSLNYVVSDIETKIPSSITITPVKNRDLQCDGNVDTLSNTNFEKELGLEVTPVSPSLPCTYSNSLTITPVGPKIMSEEHSKNEKKSCKLKNSDKVRSEKRKKRKREDSPMGPPEKVPSKIEPVKSSSGAKQLDLFSPQSSPTDILRKYPGSPTQCKSGGCGGMSNNKTSKSQINSPIYISNSPKTYSTNASPKNNILTSPKSSANSTGKPSISTLKSVITSPSSSKNSSEVKNKYKDSGNREYKEKKSNNGGTDSSKCKSAMVKLRHVDFPGTDVILSSPSDSPSSVDSKSSSPVHQIKSKKSTILAVIDRIKSKHSADSSGDESSGTNKFSPIVKNGQCTARSSSEYMVKSTEGIKITINKTKTKEQKSKSVAGSSPKYIKSSNATTPKKSSPSVKISTKYVSKSVGMPKLKSHSPKLGQVDGHRKERTVKLIKGASALGPKKAAEINDADKYKYVTPYPATVVSNLIKPLDTKFQIPKLSARTSGQVEETKKYENEQSKDGAKELASKTVNLTDKNSSPQENVRSTPNDVETVETITIHAGQSGFPLTL